MSYTLGNSIRLRLQTDFETLREGEDINKLGRTFKSISKARVQSVYFCMN